MKVSVIIPVYNAEGTIAKTIESVLKGQTSDAYALELIIINDGSSDASEAIIEEYSGQIIYRKTENNGVSAARNLGFKISTGSFIQYLDSDDLLAEGKIERQIKLLIETGADVAYGDYTKFKWQSEQLVELNRVSPEIIANPIIESFDGFWCPPAALLYTRGICEKIGDWNSRLPIIQDARYIFDAAMHGAKFVKTKSLTSYYHIGNGDSLSTRNILAFVMDCFVNTKEVKSLWQTELNDEKKAVLIKSLRYCVNEFSILQPKLVNEVIDVILELEPNYVPQQGVGLRLLSKIFGYRAAEHIAGYKRRISI